jgi:splicing factor U2AF 65 kDa subunit
MRYDDRDYSHRSHGDRDHRDRDRYERRHGDRDYRDRERYAGRGRDEYEEKRPRYDDDRRRDRRARDEEGGGGRRYPREEDAEKRGRGKQRDGLGTPERRSPTPSDATPLSQRRRKASGWDVHAPGYEQYTAMQAKQTGKLGMLLGSVAK